MATETAKSDKPVRYEMKQGTWFTVPECQKTAPEGKTFSHWSTSEDGSNGTAYKPGEHIRVYGRIRLYPQWRNIDL